jgi:pimeloyl-ACP methyl ester carboxylesterase
LRLDTHQPRLDKRQLRPGKRHLLKAATSCGLIFAALFVFARPSAGQTKAAAPQKESAPAIKSRFAMLDGQRVHYKSYGKGERALVFVHGWTCDMNVWQQQLPAFAADARLVALDLPGHGQSDKPQIKYTQDLFARALDAVLRDAGVREAVLVGHSMGTPVIRQFYRKYPAKTLALVIVDGGLRPLGVAADREKFFELLRGPQYQTVATGMVNAMLAPVKNAELRSTITATMLATPKHVAISAMDGMNAPEIFKDDKINVPVLAILARSPVWQADTEQFLRSLAPNLEYQMWEQVGHFLMVEKPHEFNQALAAFLSKNKLLNKTKGK